MESKQKEVEKRVEAFFIPALFLVLLVFGSCTAPKKEPAAEPISMPTEELEKGRVLFDQHCATCHPEGKAGLGPAIINKPLPEALIQFQIRNGVGVMPAFGEEVLSDEQVNHIAEYLVYLIQEN